MKEREDIDFYYRKAFAELERFNYWQWRRAVSRMVAAGVIIASVFYFFSG